MDHLRSQIQNLTLDHGVIQSQRLLLSKQKALHILTFTKMYHSGVTLIIDYASGIWEYKKYENIYRVQNRAFHLYLGVHAFAPNLAINGDMEWICSSTRRKLEMIRMWNRLIKIDNTCFTKKVFFMGPEL